MNLHTLNSCNLSWLLNRKCTTACLNSFSKLLGIFYFISFYFFEYYLWPLKNKYISQLYHLGCLILWFFINKRDVSLTQGCINQTFRTFTGWVVPLVGPQHSCLHPLGHHFDACKGTRSVRTCLATACISYCRWNKSKQQRNLLAWNGVGADSGWSVINNPSHQGQNWLIIKHGQSGLTPRDPPTSFSSRHFEEVRATRGLEPNIWPRAELSLSVSI